MPIVGSHNFFEENNLSRRKASAKSTESLRDSSARQRDQSGREYMVQSAKCKVRSVLVYSNNISHTTHAEKVDYKNTTPALEG